MTKNKNLNSLTPRENEVIKLVSTGATNQEIADSLFIAVTTVKIHAVLHVQENPFT